MRKINNKGYMLVELILAAALAFGMAYFLISLTMKLKDKNDDMMVTTLTKTDQAIIANILMKELYGTGDGTEFKCENISINGNTFSYNSKVNTVNEYATISKDASKGYTCNITEEEVTIRIPISVVQLPDEDFDVYIKYKK